MKCPALIWQVIHPPVTLTVLNEGDLLHYPFVPLKVTIAPKHNNNAVLNAGASH